MRRLLIVLAVGSTGCHHRDPYAFDHVPEPAPAPLGALVGSWSANHATGFWPEDVALIGSPEIVRSDLDIHEDGSFAEAWYDEAGHHICTRTGVAVRKVDDELSFAAADDDASNTCDPPGSYYVDYWVGGQPYSSYWEGVQPYDNYVITNIVSLTDEELVYKLPRSHLPRDATDLSSLEVTYRRRPTWLVPQELIGIDNWPVLCERPPVDTRAARHSRCDSNIAVASSDDSDSTDTPYFEGLSASELVIWALHLPDQMTWGDSDEGDIATWVGWSDTPDFTLAEGDGYADPYSTSSSWSMWPNLQTGYAYRFVIVVPATAGHPHATLRLDFQDEARDMKGGPSDDGTMYLLEAQFTKRIAPHEVEIKFQADGSLRDIPSVLKIYTSTDAR